MIVVMTVPERQNTICADVAQIAGMYVVDTDHCGALPCAIEALECGLSHDGPVTILQDDVSVCRNFRAYLRRFEQYIDEGKQIVKWSDFNCGFTPRGMLPRLVQCEPETFTCTQAVTYSRYWARKILAFLQALPVLNHRPPIHGDDNWICEALKVYNQKYFIHRPSIAQHIGYDSIVSPGLTLTDWRRAHDFVGTDFDPLTWPMPTFQLL
jgi:hypothetical protein